MTWDVVVAAVQNAKEFDIEEDVLGDAMKVWDFLYQIIKFIIINCSYFFKERDLAMIQKYFTISLEGKFHGENTVSQREGGSLADF